MSDQPGPPEDVDDWQDLLPSRDSERLGWLYDSCELAMYADPDEFTIRQGLYASLALTQLPLFILTFLLVGLMLANGEITIAELIAAFQDAGTNTHSQSISWRPIARQIMVSAFLIPISLGITLLLKTVFKALAKIQRWSP